MGDLSLVLFTVLSQMAAGATITLWLLDIRAGTVSNELGKRIIGVIVCITGVSLLVSLTHLGEPMGAYRALAHLGNSWLSREVAFFGILIAVQVLYYRQWQNGTQRVMTGSVAAFFAICAVLASGMVYVLPARPAWNNAGPVLFFLFTAALLGPLLIAVLYRYYKAAVPGRLYVAVATVLGAGLFSFILYTTLLYGSGGVTALTGNNLLASSSFWPRVVIGWIVPLLILGYGALRRSDVTQWAFYLLVLTMVGEILGRELFYSTVVALQVSAF